MSEVSDLYVTNNYLETKDIAQKKEEIPETSVSLNSMNYFCVSGNTEELLNIINHMLNFMNHQKEEEIKELDRKNAEKRKELEYLHNKIYRRKKNETNCHQPQHGAEYHG